MQDEPSYVVGMDAHSRKLAISIWDWSDRFNARLLRNFKCVDIEAMIKTYERHVDTDSITIIESSTNSAYLKMKLNAAGYRAEIVRADIIAHKECKRKICDMTDAENLALAYIKGDIDEFVWAPSQKHEEYRDIMFAYRDTSAAKKNTRRGFAHILARAKIHSNTGALPQPPSGEHCSPEPQRAAEYVRAISVFAKIYFHAIFFLLSPLTQYILAKAKSGYSASVSRFEELAPARLIYD